LLWKNHILLAVTEIIILLTCEIYDSIAGIWHEIFVDCIMISLNEFLMSDGRIQRSNDTMRYRTKHCNTITDSFI